MIFWAVILLNLLIAPWVFVIGLALVIPLLLALVAGCFVVALVQVRRQGFAGDIARP